MDTQSISEVIDRVESLDSGDLVVFEDSDGQTYKTSVIDVWSSGPYTMYELEDDFVLKLLYDPEGGPVTVKVSDGDRSVQVVAFEIKE